MLVKQISVFLENNPGRLADVTSVLGDNDIDIRALSIADTTDFGILRIIVNNPDKALEKLKAEGFTVNSTNIITIAIDDTPGGLAMCLRILMNAHIGIEYMYAFTGKIVDKALVVIRAANNEEAIKIFEKNNIRVLTENEVYNMI